MHRVVDLILGLKHLLEAKIVMALLQCVKRDVLVVLREYISVLTAARVLHVALDGTCCPARAGCGLAEDAVVRLGGLLGVKRRLRLRRLNAEAVLHAKPIIATVAAVSHFSFFYNC